MGQPAAFISHGSPTYALAPGEAGAALRAWAAQQDARGDTPSAVLVMSPHWQTQGLEIMGAARPETWHDFGGFPPALYDLNYPAPGAPAVAHSVHELLASHGFQAEVNTHRPFDHGAWVPMMHLWPDAQVPMLQLSLPLDATPSFLLDLGRALAPLRAQGVMLLGSGSMTHNLSHVTGRGAVVSTAYVRVFADWVLARLSAHDVSALTAFEFDAPHVHEAHPQTEHFLPLFFALGSVASDEAMQVLTRAVYLDALAMDAMVWHPEETSP